MSCGSKKGTQIYYPFHSKSPSKQIPYRFSCGAPMERYTHLQGIFTSLFIFFSESPVREPPPCSLTGFPWTGILCHQSRWSIYSFIHVCLPEPPKRTPPTYGKNIRSPSTEPHTDRRPTYSGMRPGSPRGSL